MRAMGELRYKRVLLKVSAGDWVEDLEERGQELKKLLNVKK